MRQYDPKNGLKPAYRLALIQRFAKERASIIGPVIPRSSFLSKAHCTAVKFDRKAVSRVENCGKLVERVLVGCLIVACDRFCTDVIGIINATHLRDQLLRHTFQDG